MYKQNKIRYFLDLLLFPGLVLHEFAHALVVEIIPNAEITDFKVTLHDGGHVKYKYYPTATRAFVIGFAPFYINTSIAFWAIFTLFNISILSNPIVNIPKFIILYLISISSASKAMPSYVDSVAHIELMRKQLFTRRFPVIFLIGPFYILLSLPAILTSKLRKRSSNLYYSIGITYAIIILGVAIGIELNYSSISDFIDSLDNLV